MPKNVIEQYNSFFYKDLKYNWQNEWRMMLDPANIDKKEDYYILETKPLKCAMRLTVSQLYFKSL